MCDDDEIFGDLDKAFQKQLKHGKLRFLDDLRTMMVSDNKLLDEYKRPIALSFKMMKLFIGRNNYQIDSITLKDWEVFGINHPDILYRIGYLSVHYESMFSETHRSSNLSDSDDSDSGHLQPSFEVMDEAFQTGIREESSGYLRRLCELCGSDFELEGEMESVSKAFRDMITFIRSVNSNHKTTGISVEPSNEVIEFNSSHVVCLEHTLGLMDLEQFGLTSDLIHRIGFLAHCMKDVEDEE